MGGDMDIWMDREERGKLYLGQRYEYMLEGAGGHGRWSVSLNEQTNSGGKREKHGHHPGAGCPLSARFCAEYRAPVLKELVVPM